MSETGLGYKVELEVFEGPLDLLLHLVKKHELDILDIPISFVTERYLEYLDFMKQVNLDVAGEYLLMAATLAHIKSRELLPPDPTEDVSEADEEELDPRQDLIRRLLEYQKYRTAADHLSRQPVVGRNVWTRGAPREEALSENVERDVQAPLAEFSVTKLIEAFDRVLSRAKVVLAHNVEIERLSVSERINELADRLESQGSFTFSSCFGFLDSEEPLPIDAVRHEAVVTFLAVLEMAKLGIIRLSQAASDEAGESDIFISAATENLLDAVAQKVAATDDEYR